MPITIEARESASLLDAGVYEATIVQINEEPAKQYDSDQVKLFLQTDLLKDNGEPIVQWAWASATLSPKSKLWKWLVAVTGQKPVFGETFDVEAALLNKRCQFVLTWNDEKQRMQVSDLLGVQRTGRGAAPAASTASMGAAPAAFAASPDQELGPCAFPKCGRQSVQFDEDGNGVCVRHGGKE